MSVTAKAPTQIPRSTLGMTWLRECKTTCNDDVFTDSSARLQAAQLIAERLRLRMTEAA